MIKSTFLLILLSLSLVTFAKDNKPNVIIIYTDDLGPGMLSCYGQELIQTPNIDKLANNGIKFNNFYGNNVCAPARANLLTGLHDGNNFRANKGSLSIQLHRGEISQSEFDKKLAKTYEDRKDYTFIGQMAQQAGYHTSFFGKLGMGYSENHDLIKLYGFDHYIGIYDSVVAWTFYPEFYWDNGEKIPLPNNPKFNKRSPSCPLIGEENMTYTEDIWLNEALQYLEDKKDEPFFMIYATQLPHGPASIAPKDHIFKDHKDWNEKERVYASMIHKLDQSVGALSDKLKELNIEKETVIIFTSDNGHEPNNYAKMRHKMNEQGLFWDAHHRGEDRFHGSLGKRGTKRYNFEGGIRVPTIVTWPGQIKSNTETDLHAITYDLFATCADIMGSEVKYQTDGISFKNELIGLAQEKHKFLYWQNSTGAARDALLQGKWKIVNEKDLENSDFPNKKRVYKWALYNLDEDPYEKNDIKSQYPEKFQQLLSLIPKK